jgi:hypothetical protein
MTLEKPKDEECGNCYYCVSTQWSREEGVFNIVKKIYEEYFCRRFPKVFYRCKGGLYGPETLETTNTVDKSYWCGEWRRRE